MEHDEYRANLNAIAIVQRQRPCHHLLAKYCAVLALQIFNRRALAVDDDARVTA